MIKFEVRSAKFEVRRTFTRALACRMFVVGAGVAAYAAYRVVRMLPSLLPPLWWTIPANAAIP